MAGPFQQELMRRAKAGDNFPPARSKKESGRWASNPSRPSSKTRFCIRTTRTDAHQNALKRTPVGVRVGVKFYDHRAQPVTIQIRRSDYPDYMSYLDATCEPIGGAMNPAVWDEDEQEWVLDDKAAASTDEGCPSARR